METININIPGNEYQVFIDRGIVKQLTHFLKKYYSNQKVLVVTDDYFKDKYAKLIFNSLKKSGFSTHIHIMRGGKFSKSFNEVLKIYGELEIEDFARDSVLIALGGGVIGDLAGFVASTWYRGMGLIHVPTTLMAMIDSSIGGKVAVNYRETINGVGSYYHPNANFMDLDLIHSLGHRDYYSGLAEIIKCAVIADVRFIKFLENKSEKILQRDDTVLIQIMKRTIEIKVDHVCNDVREGGKRLLLNYGHTLGHAIEMATQTDENEAFRHGEGVSLGIVAALSIAESYLNVSKSVRKTILNLLKLYKLPVSFSASKYGFEKNELIHKCMRLALKDKKRKNNQLRFILINKLGFAEVCQGITKEFILKALNDVIKD